MIENIAYVKFLPDVARQSFSLSANERKTGIAFLEVLCETKFYWVTFKFSPDIFRLIMYCTPYKWGRQ